jgi:hypothetical protein
VTIRETHKLEGAFAATDEVVMVREHMETWSQLVFDALTSGEGLSSSWRWPDRGQPVHPANGTA